MQLCMMFVSARKGEAVTAFSDERWPNERWRLADLLSLFGSVHDNVQLTSRSGRHAIVSVDEAEGHLRTIGDLALGDAGGFLRIDWSDSGLTELYTIPIENNFDGRKLKLTRVRWDTFDIIVEVEEDGNITEAPLLDVIADIAPSLDR